MSDHHCGFGPVLIQGFSSVPSLIITFLFWPHEHQTYTDLYFKLLIQGENRPEHHAGHVNMMLKCDFLMWMKCKIDNFDLNSA